MLLKKYRLVFINHSNSKNCGYSEINLMLLAFLICKGFFKFKAYR